MEPILFKKVRNVKSIVGNRIEDSGLDFFVPVFDEKFLIDFKNKNTQMLDSNNIVIDVSHKYKSYNFFLLRSQARILIPSGIHVRIPQLKINLANNSVLDLSKYFKISLEANNKSGVCSKKGLIFGSSVVDFGYHGEIHLSIINTTQHDVEIIENEKIIQFIPHVVANNPITEFAGTLEEMYSGHDSNRGQRGFGEGTGKD